MKPTCDMDTLLGGHIADAAADVYGQLGGGLSEAIYQKAMALALKQRGCDVDTEVVVPIVYHGAYVGFVRPDLVVQKQVVLELKAVTRIVDAHLVQLRAYMRWLPPKPPSLRPSVLNAWANINRHGHLNSCRSRGDSRAWP